MKIYIETEMKQMPKGCAECKYSKTINSVKKEGKLVACSYVQALKITFNDEYFNSRPSWYPLKEINALPEIIHEMAEAQTLEKTLKVHTDKLTAEFQLKLVSVEFKEEKE